MPSKRANRPAAAKSSVKRRTPNPARSPRVVDGTPDQEQDIQRRLGNFTGKGEHARQGGRTTGIVGQKKKQVRTDRKRK
jgi:hypothetical protein